MKFSSTTWGSPGVDIAIKPVRSIFMATGRFLVNVGAPDDINKEEARVFTFYQGDVKENRISIDG
jgi:hypothetical protein